MLIPMGKPHFYTPVGASGRGRKWKANLILCSFGFAHLDVARIRGAISLNMHLNSSHGAPDARLATMEEIGQNIQFVPEKTLQDITKGKLVKFTLNCLENEFVLY